MRHPDLESAQRHLDGLRALLGGDAGKGLETLAALELLAGSLTRALPDVICQDRLSDLRFYAAELWSGSPSARWERDALSAPDYLRLQIMKALNALDARLQSLHAMRLASAGTVNARARGRT